MDKKSAVTEFIEISAFSGAPAECKHHLIFGRGLRELADQDGLWIPLKNSEHNMSSEGLIYQIHENPTAEKLSKMLGQAIFEKEYYRNYTDLYDFKDDIARKAFMKRYGRSWL